MRRNFNRLVLGLMLVSATTGAKPAQACEGGAVGTVNTATPVLITATHEKSTNLWIWGDCKTQVSEKSVSWGLGQEAVKVQIAKTGASDTMSFDVDRDGKPDAYSWKDASGTYHLLRVMKSGEIDPPYDSKMP
jgi:hypothetical protein